MIEVPAAILSKRDRIALKNELKSSSFITAMEDKLTEVFNVTVISGGRARTNNPNRGTAYGNNPSGNEPAYYFVRVRREETDGNTIPDPFAAKRGKTARRIANMHPLGVLLHKGDQKSPQEGELWSCRYLSKDRKGILLMKRVGVSQKFLSLGDTESSYSQSAKSWAANDPRMLGNYSSNNQGEITPGDNGDDGSEESQVILDGVFGRKLREFGRNNWRSCQPTIKQLDWLLRTKKIKSVIRMNGNTKGDGKARDGGFVSWEAERRKCEEYGASWQFINSHDDYVPGKGYVLSKARCWPFFEAGSCFMHCRNGDDRTGWLAGAFRKQNEGITDLEALWRYAISFNSWGGKNGRVCTCRAEGAVNRGYAMYLDGFYPLDKWCAETNGTKPVNRSACNLCKYGLKKLGFRT